MADFPAQRLHNGTRLHQYWAAARAYAQEVSVTSREFMEKCARVASRSSVSREAAADDQTSPLAARTRLLSIVRIALKRSGHRRGDRNAEPVRTHAL
jgi:hypothetical protein